MPGLIQLMIALTVLEVIVCIAFFAYVWPDLREAVKNAKAARSTGDSAGS